MIKKLDELVGTNTIAQYKVCNVSEDGKEHSYSKFGNHERLTIEFNNGQTLTVDCMCSGINENLTLMFE
jgi:hypothetical protein